MHKYARALTHPQAHCQRCTGGASCELRAPHQKDTSDFSDRSQMMMHRDLLSLQRQNKRTNMKEKSINIRRLIKLFFPAEFTTKVLGLVFFFYSSTNDKTKWREILESEDWLSDGATTWAVYRETAWLGCTVNMWGQVKVSMHHDNIFSV